MMDFLYILLTTVLATGTYGLPIVMSGGDDLTLPEQNLQFAVYHYMTGEHEKLIEGDIRMNQAEHKMAVQNKYLIWTSRIIPYTIDKAFSPSEKNNITTAMNEIQIYMLLNTCIKFKKRTDETDYLNITRTPGCYSSVGRDGGAQKLSLGEGCTHRGTIYHELMHALGFWHEHNRPDRDQYITVFWDNIRKDHHGDYYKMSTNEVDTLDQKYDYGSIMHYSQRTFVKNPEDNSMKTFVPIIQSLDSSVIIGQRTNLSAIDLQKIQILYKCDMINCYKPPPSIKNGNKSTESRRIGTNVDYKCNDVGNTLVGPSRIFCKYDGTWSGFEPQCLNSARVKYCSFDSNSSKFCDWKQDITDDLNWTWSQKKTQTELTGPTVDNTLEDGQGGFVYVESSLPAKVGQKARLISALIKSPQKKQCVSLYYHMFGSTMGNLTIYAKMSSEAKTLFSISRDRGNAWHYVETSFDPQNRDYEIVIEAVVGSGPWSDIGIDDVIIKDCNLGQEDEKSTSPSSYKVVHSCDFNNGYCGWSQDLNDEIDWSVNSGSTPTFLTGPDCDRLNCSHGKYLYLEASGSASLGDRAKIESPIFQEFGTYCITFYASMFGSDIGSVEMDANFGNGNLFRLWKLDGNQGQGWKKVKTDLKAIAPFKIEITGRRGNGYRGDIGIDDIYVTNDSCQVDLNCNFEDDFCDWENVDTDNFDWIRNRGSTPTPGTGPSQDHTSSSGYYVYLESSAPQRLYDKARLVSKEIKRHSSEKCLQFWYHMYGQHVSLLRVIRLNSNGQEEHLWKMHNNQGNTWHEALIDFPMTDTSFKIVIEGEVGSSYTGDIAIDDIMLTDGRCQRPLIK